MQIEVERSHKQENLDSHSYVKTSGTFYTCWNVNVQIVDSTQLLFDSDRTSFDSGPNSDLARLAVQLQKADFIRLISERAQPWDRKIQAHEAVVSNQVSKLQIVSGT